MRIGIVTDEISLDVREAISIGVGWGLKDFEFRTCASGRVPYVSEQDLQVLSDCKKEFGLNITALSPGLFKIPIDDDAAVQKDLYEVLPATIQLARKFQTPSILTFGFVRTPEAESAEFDRVVELLGRAAELAGRDGITLALENEPGYWADSGRKTAKVLVAVNSKYLQANWDPANALGAERYPFPVGYEAVKRWVVNIHVKDVQRKAALECVAIGGGKINWEGQIRALIDENRLDHVTIETHCLPLLEKSKQNVETVSRLLKKIEEEQSTNSAGL